MPTNAVNKPKFVFEISDLDKGRLHELRTLKERRTGDRLSLSDTVRIALRSELEREQAQASHAAR